MHARLNRRIFLESTAAIMAAPSAALGADEAERRRIRVASFNIQIGRGTDGKYDLKRTANALRLMKPDLIGLQEVDRGTDRSHGEDQARTLADLLKLPFAFGKASDRPGGEYGNAVLSRWPIIEQDNHLLPSWGEQRAVLSTTIDVPRAGPIRFLSAHLQSPNRERQRPQRIGQIERISRLFARGGSPVILAADVNAQPDSDELKRLREDWIDATQSASGGTFPADQPDRRLDYIFVRRCDAWAMVRAEVIAEPIASDHRPVLAVLETRFS